MNAPSLRLGLGKATSNDVFKSIDWSKDDDWTDLSVGQSEWRSSTLVGSAGKRQLTRELSLCKSEAQRLRESRMYFSVRLIGDYVRIRRLPMGPVHKLSDWRQLPLGECMLEHPAPTFEDIKSVEARIFYLSQKGEHGYTWTSDKTGALWICRLAESDEHSPS